MLTLFNPWRTLTEDTDWFFNGSNGTPTYAPTVDITEQSDHYRIEMDLPGVEAEDVNVSVEKSVLSISGERKIEQDEKREGYYRFERSRGAFSRSFTLPEDVDVEHISASNKNGVLTVQIPKAAVAKPRSIEIKTLS